MKNIVKLMFAGVTLVALPAAAQAECNLIAGGNTSLDALLTFNGQPAPAPATQVAPLAAEALMKVAAYKSAVAGCTEADVARELSRLNWPDSSKLISVSDQFIVPKLAPVVLAPPPPSTVVVTVTETPTVKPVAEPSAELRRTQAELQNAKQQQNALRAQVAAIAARPTNTKLSPADRAKVDQLLNVNKVVKDLEAVAKRLTQAEKDIATLKTGKANVGDSYTKAEADSTFATKADLTNQPKSEGALPWWMEWLLYAAFAIALVALGIGVYNWRTKASKKDLGKVEVDQAAMATVMKQIEIEESMEMELDSLPVGQYRESFVSVDGVRGLLGFTKSGKGMVTTNQIENQTQAMNIATLRSTIKRHIGAGRVTLHPYVKDSAAA